MYVISKRVPQGRVITIRLTSHDPLGKEFLTLLEVLSERGGTIRIVLAGGSVYNLDYPLRQERRQ